MILEVNDDNLYLLEETIKENTEWLSTIDGDEVECVSIENLESILSFFLGKRLELKQ